MVAVTAVLIVLTGIALEVSILTRWVRRLRAEAADALERAVGKEKVYVVEDCNFFGRLSAGYAQVRGNGMLALTDRGIHFRMLYPRRYLFIPLHAVGAVSNPRSFLGKWKGRELLRVDFAAGEGEEDACAFLVRFPEWWREALRSLAAGGEPPPVPGLRE